MTTEWRWKLTPAYFVTLEIDGQAVMPPVFEQDPLIVDKVCEEDERRDVSVAAIELVIDALRRHESTVEDGAGVKVEHFIHEGGKL